MALLDDLFKKNMVVGLAIGVGAALFLPTVLPVLARSAKPVLKGLIKSGYAAYETARETLAELKEVTEDVVAEAVSEIQTEKMAAAAGLAEVAEDLGEAGDASAPTGG